MPSGPPARILLVDDEADIVNITKRGLEQSGFAVDAFTNPQTALDSYRADTYDRIVTDIRMAGMTGFQLAREIWAADPNANFCFLSAFEIHYGEAKKVMPSLKSYCFLTKPMLPSVLAKHLEGHLSRKLLDS
jgi:DNA-binding response OmpR family regulator